MTLGLTGAAITPRTKAKQHPAKISLRRVIGSRSTGTLFTKNESLRQRKFVFVNPCFVWAGQALAYSPRRAFAFKLSIFAFETPYAKVAC